MEGKRYFNTKTQTNDIGLIAQEIIKYYPELVSEMPYVDQASGETNEKRYMVKYNGLIPVLVNAINEQVNSTDKKLLKSIDFSGKEVSPENNKPFISIYNDGSVERKIIIE